MKTNTASKRILSVTVTRETDTDPDFSYLGEYSDAPKEFAIAATGEHEGELVDQLPCECGHAVDQHAETSDYAIGSGGIKCSVVDCDCEDLDRVTVERGRDYRYFNSGSIDSSVTDEDNRQYAQQDFKRMQDYNRLEWCFLGIHAKAEIQVAGSTTQTIRSGGLWGIESDSGDDYLTEVENQQLDELKDELHAIGFSKRAIAAAFRDVKRRDE